MVDTTTTSPVPAETITPTEVVDTPLAEVELPPVGGNETVQGEVDSNPFENPLTEIDIPLTDIDVPSNGPEFLKPPNFLETNTNPPETGNTDQGLTDEPSVTDPPFVNPENQDASGAGLVSPIAQDAAGGIPAGLGIVPAPPDTVIDSSSSSSSSGSQDNINKPSGGLIDNVVSGIASGLGGGSNNGIGGLQVDLGPVLDAVATLLRGPIRSAIANRRSEYAQRSDTVLARTKPVFLPSVARLTEPDPNVIPIGHYAREPINDRPIEDPNIIPLKSEKNGPVPLGLVASPRLDALRETDDDDLLHLSPEVIERVQKSQNKNDPIFVDENRLIINDHVVQQNHEIIDVLSRKEQGHLFGRENGQPMAIKILPGTPMNIQQLPAQNGEYQRQEETQHKEGGFFSNFENPLLGLIKAFDTNKKQDIPPPPPPPPHHHPTTRQPVKKSVSIIAFY